ncbi:Uncharacterised protein [BD1-7 clade bacterium]|uniref:Uncharacterized protein n=1 Tax=BD1-7 clade bacterium TaxID=2029982 RepID=A0A5S9QU23_9GAMM|nr:Uncharacterised protein [BD1-7 clade bacterium]
MNRTIPEIARVVLGVEKLPKHLVAPLNTIFTKTFNTAQKGPYSSFIVRNDRDTGWVMSTEYENLVFNALILMYLMPKPSDARDIIVKKIRNEPVERHLAILKNRVVNNFPLFFCFGIVEENIASIISALTNSEFNITVSRLPIPFKRDTLEPITWDLEQFDWAGLSRDYHCALSDFYAGSLDVARDSLIAMQTKTPMRLPIVDDLLARIARDMHEAEEVFHYLNANL